MANESTYTYDPATGTWKPSSSESSSGSSNSGSSSSSKGDNLKSSTSDSNSSGGSVEKKYNEIEVNTLSGTLNFICTKETIKLKAGDTIKLKGLGSYLSGRYYVKDVTRQISSSGYSHSATLIKTDFGKSLKVKTKSSANKSVKKSTTKKVTSSPAPKQSPQRTYTVKKGDTLWGIAKKFYGDGSKYTKIYDANTHKVANPSLIYVGQELIIP